VVVVTPAVYVTDNRVTLDAIAQLGSEARGIAVIHPTITDAELKTLADGGICGIRFTQFDPKTATTTIDMIEPLSKRVNDLGWHVQIHMRADQIAAAEDLWRRLPSPIVFDHMGRLPQPEGVDAPAFTIIRRLIDDGHTWVKLSGAYIDTKTGTPGYADVTKVAQAYVKAAPERLVWGSDWPHPTEGADHKPDDAVLFDLLAEWVPDAGTRRRILVENPETLYGFTKAI
jgi:predicted TIM-barrel fold metal-dependent hydrolase